MSTSRKGNEPWRNIERHYCACCNAWMGSDRQSIMIHENGKKHKENLEASLQKRREDKLQNEKYENDLEASLRKIEKAAALAHSKDRCSVVPYGSSFLNHGSNSNVSTYHGTSPPGVNIQSSQNNGPREMASNRNAKFGKKPVLDKSKEIDSWQERKRLRESSNVKDTETNISGNSQFGSNTKVNSIIKQLGENEGHYSIGSETYLEGSVYIKIMEIDMPVQIWTGSTTTKIEYRQSEEAQDMWKFGIVVKVHKVASENDDLVLSSCDISYFSNPEDEDEVIEKNVRGERLRLVLGSEEVIPSTIEEARLALFGGEEIIHHDSTKIAIDENTGFSSWGTVTVKKITVSQEIKNDRARKRAKKTEKLEEEKKEKRHSDERKMEEAKYANADDSALGAYDVWSNGKGGYKGVKIADDFKVDVNEMAKSLARGKSNVSFKKTGFNKKGSLFKKSKKKQSLRKTYADDDD